MLCYFLIHRQTGCNWGKISTSPLWKALTYLQHARWVSPWEQHVETAHCLNLCVQFLSMLWVEHGARLPPTPFLHKGAALGSICWVYPSNHGRGKANNLPVPPACYRPTLRSLNAGCHYKHKLHSIFNDELFLESTGNDSALSGRNLLIWSQAGGVSSLVNKWLAAGLRVALVDCW